MSSPPLRLRVEPPSSTGGRRGTYFPGRLNRPLRWIVAGLLIVAFWPPSGFAVDRVFLEPGAGKEGNLIRIGAQWELEKQWFAGGKWHLGALLEVGIGSWRPELGDDGLYEIGFTPVFRLAPNRTSSGRLTPFFEAAVGAHLLSNVRFSDLNLSTGLQFGSHIGAGVFFGHDRRFSLVYRFQHLSNASIKQPNPGIEFHLLQLGYCFSPRR